MHHCALQQGRREHGEHEPRRDDLPTLYSWTDILTDPYLTAILPRVAGGREDVVVLALASRTAPRAPFLDAQDVHARIVKSPL